MRELKGQLTIVRTDSNRGPSCVTIEFEDEASHCLAAQVEVDLEGFAMALFGRACVPCRLKFNDSGVIGLKREYKRVDVFVPGNSYDSGRDILARKAVRKAEADGWKGRAEDALNSHNRVRSTGPDDPEGAGEYYQVLFERYVETD